MPSYFVFGKKPNDFSLMVDFQKKRAIVRANTAFIEGTYLEPVPPGINGYCPGMVLVSKDWRNVYFLIERSEWDDSQYFKLAEDLLKRKKILTP